MLTAEEARQKTIDVRESSISEYHVDFDDIYNWIDFQIEEAANEGKNSVYVTVDGCDESWNCVYYKRDEIIKHYTDLGYRVTNHGYERCITSDCFTINW